MDKAVSTPMIDRLVVEVRDHMVAWAEHETKADKLADEATEHEDAALEERAKAGQKLVQLRFQVEADGERWWPWFEANKHRFKAEGLEVERHTAKRLLKIGRADDSQAELEAQRAKGREDTAKSRAKAKGVGTYNTDVSTKPDPTTSWLVEAVSMDGRVWRSGVILGTREEAEIYIDRYARHEVEGFAIAAVLECAETPTNWITGKSRPTLCFMHGECGLLHWSETGAPPAPETVETVKAAAKAWADLAAKVDRPRVPDPRQIDLEDVIEAAPAPAEEYPDLPDGLDRRKAESAPAEPFKLKPGTKIPTKKPCKTCGGTGRIVGKTGMSVDCDCVRKGAA
jgi:hypothetical protein